MKIRPCNFFFIVVTIVAVGCKPTREYVMPYVNGDVSGSRFFPTAKNDDPFMFRAWVSLSTSIDRVFTIYRNEDGKYTGKLLEIDRQNVWDTIKDKTKFKETFIKPKCGFKEFIFKVDSLKLLELKDNNQADTVIYATDQPYSLFVVDIKEGEKFNEFRFTTYYPQKYKTERRYQDVQDLILKELPFKFYFKHTSKKKKKRKNQKQ